LTSLNIAHII